MIPDEAVEAAAQRLARHRWPTALEVWDSFGQGMKDDYRDTARAALEAAAPHMLADAWELGMVSMYATTGGEWPLIPEQNPYRPTV